LVEWYDLIVAAIDWARGLYRGNFLPFSLYISSFIKLVYVFKVEFDIIKSIGIKGIGFVASEGRIVMTYTNVS
jgi:hypothetical protein